MKLSYTRPGNAQFIAKIFVFNMATAKTVAREMYTPRYLYIKYVFFTFNCLARIDCRVERTIRLRKMPSVVCYPFFFFTFFYYYNY